MKRLLVALALVLAACSSDEEKKPDGPRLHVPSPDWSRQVVYFVMTDRFANGDTSNDDQGAGEYDPTTNAKYSGGDLQGIIDRLDYIQGLGATAVWITPPVANMWWDPLVDFGGYHGYWARDLKEVDEHLGDLDTYRKLADALHRRGMYLIQDVVPNHMGNFFTWTGPYDPADPTKNFVRNTEAVPTGAPTQAPFDQNDVLDPAQRAAAVYHWTPAIADYGDPVQETDWQISDLDDLNSENPAVRAALKDSYGYWIREVGVDAFRVDTAKFMPHDFWNDFFHTADGILATAKATGRDDFLAFGEVFDASDPYDDAGEKKLSSFLGTAGEPELPSVLQFPLYTEIGRVFGGGKPTAQLAYRLQKFVDPALFPHPERIPVFIDNHDVARFITVGNRDALKQALAFLFTVPGIPVVYYGTEQPFYRKDGEEIPFTETRQSMFAAGWSSGGVDHFDTSSIYYQRIARLAALRRASPVFTGTALDVLYDTPAGPGALVYARGTGADRALVVFNTSDDPALMAHVDTGLPAGTVMEVLYTEKDPGDPVIAQGGLLTAELPPRAVLIAKATPETKDPGTPPATIAVSTKVEGETFTKDVTISGTVTPASTRLDLVVDGRVGSGAPIDVGTDGSWSVVLPVSLYPVGKQTHDLVVWAPDVRVASDRFVFQTDVVFEGATVVVDDPPGDDRGPAGTYTYPQDATFRDQMDVTQVVVEAGKTTLTLKVTMADFSDVWNAPFKFDHVCFNVFFDVPGEDGVTFLPKLQGTTPEGFAWDHWNFTYGWIAQLYGAEGASPTAPGTLLAASPTVVAQPATRTIVLSYDRNAFGLDTWEGTRIYLTTWDYDGIGATYRPIDPAGGTWVVGGGAATDPYVMDDVPPITVPEIP